MKDTNKKEIILNAAQEIFFQKSFYEATMDDIAKLSGIKKPTIYYYFPSKIDLASELIEQNIKKLFGKMEEIILNTRDVKERIGMIVDFYINLFEENSKLFIVIQRIGYDFMQKEDNKKKINALFEKLRKRQSKTGNLFGEVLLANDKKVSGDTFLFSIFASIGRSIFEEISRGKKPQKNDLLAIKDIFIAAVK